MSTQAIEADTAPAEGQQPLQTVGDAFSQLRADVLRDLALEAMGNAPKNEAEAAPAPDPETETEPAAETESVLSQPEETPAAAEAAAAEETEPEPEEDHLDEELRTALDDRLKERISRRIGKEVAKTKEARERTAELATRVQELEARLAERPATPATTTVKPVPLAHVTDVQSLQSESAKAEQALDLCDDLLDKVEDRPEHVEQVLRDNGFKLTDASGNEDYSPATMRQALRSIRRNADRMLHKDIPARESFLKEATQLADTAVNLLPDLKDRTSPRFARFQAVLKQRPELKNYPTWPIDTLVAVLGQEALEAMVAKAKPAPKAAAKRAIPTKIPKPSATPPPTPPPTPNNEELGRRALEGDKNARQAYIKSILPKIPGL